MNIECPHHNDINPIELDRDGGHYVYWVERLTRDDLHSKADIAQCLGWQRREIERLRARDERAALIALLDAAPDIYGSLECLIARYVGLVNSGDCGNWNPELEAEVIGARAALARARGEA